MNDSDYNYQQHIHAHDLERMIKDVLNTLEHGKRNFGNNQKATLVSIVQQIDKVNKEARRQLRDDYNVKRVVCNSAEVDD